MCGIAGFVSAHFDHTDDLRIEAITRSLRHRGPDEEGIWKDVNLGIALGHRRLAILDLTESGRQPMLSASGALVTVYNGELYNYLELRSELQEAGQIFRGTGDTEVILAAVEHWGIDRACERFNGMFAAAIFDRRRMELHLFRDRMGIKPLYFGTADSTFFFASELRALRAASRSSFEVDETARELFLQFGYIPGARSIYKGIRKLLPGSILTISIAQRDRLADINSIAAGTPSYRRYWSLAKVAERSPSAASPADLQLEFDRLFLAAAKRHTISDVPVGAMLSGGIDSSSVVSALSRFSTVRTFSIGWRDAYYDEAPAAQEIARLLKTEHTELIVDEGDVLEVVPQLAEFYDEPFADSSQIPTYLVSRLARQKVTVCLSGDGGDELFGGYQRYVWGRRIDAAHSILPGPMALLGSALFDLSAKAAGIGNAFPAIVPNGINPEHLSTALSKMSRLLAEPSRGERYRRLVTTASTNQHRPEDLQEIFSTFSAKGNPADPVLRMMLWDSLYYLPDDILTKVDRASMAVSLEVRVPLLDAEIVDFVWSLPANVRLGALGSKEPLRRFLAKSLPPQLFDRPKQGFGIPIHSYLRGPLRDWADTLIRHCDGGHRDSLITAWDTFLVDGRRWTPYIWHGIVYEAWLERWMRKPQLSSSPQESAHP